MTLSASTISQSKQFKCVKLRTLGRHKNDTEALMLLSLAAEQAEPIMRKRTWKVPLLEEFLPRNPNLLGLNVNRGQVIRIRLRRPRDEMTLYNFEHVIGTLLHELVHIVHGKHDVDFYKLLDELSNECDDLIRKGIKGSGQGFDVKGYKLDGERHNAPYHQRRHVAAEAALQRARKKELMPGARVLGGDRNGMLLSPRESSLRAAKRRAFDDHWCSRSNNSDEETVAEEIIERHENSEVGTSSSNSEIAKSVLNVGKKGRRIESVAQHNNTKRHRLNSALFSWMCAQCTLRNTAACLYCDACCAPKLSKTTQAERWSCGNCNLVNTDRDVACTYCTSSKDDGIIWID